jgi:inositol transport system ATP-binding protein
MDGITKTFPGVRALDRVHLAVAAGQVHALMGENGAGKSTLMKILIGIYPADSGTIRFRQTPVRFTSVSEALRAGISMIHQELCPVPHMTVAENIFLGREPTYPFTPWVRSREMNHRTRLRLAQLQVVIDPCSKMKDLSIAHTQMVEIAKALSYGSDLIVMDEPTSAITEKEISHLLRIIRELTRQGVAVIYISHKLDEVFSIADQITVLRDGRNVETVSKSQVDRKRVIRMMVGRELDQLFPKQEVTKGPPRLEVRNLSRPGAFRNVNFQVHGGEILGIAGLMGAGRTEIVESIFGIVPPDSGAILVNGRPMAPASPRVAIAHGLALLTEDRKRSGLFPRHDLRANMCVASLDRFTGRLLVNHRRMNRACQRQIDALHIKTPGLGQIVDNLSGGNQQKVLVARWLLTQPDILFLDEPTRGIDVGAKAEIHRWMTRLAQEGKAIVMISSEMPEILGMSDRIMVIHDGTVAGVLSRPEATQETIMHLAMGWAEPPPASRGAEGTER